MAIKAGMSVAEAILQLTRGFQKIMGRKPDGLEKIKIQQEAVERLKKAEATFREKMYKFDDVLKGKVSKDKVNKPLSKELKKKYRANVTQFMRDALGLKKKVK